MDSMFFELGKFFLAVIFGLASIFLTAYIFAITFKSVGVCVISPFA